MHHNTQTRYTFKVKKLPSSLNNSSELYQNISNTLLFILFVKLKECNKKLFGLSYINAWLCLLASIPKSFIEIPFWFLIHHVDTQTFKTDGRLRCNFDNMKIYQSTCLEKHVVMVG